MADDLALPPPERGNHGEIVIIEVVGPEGGKRAQALYDRKIDKYFAKGRLGKTREENVAHYEAAVRYLELSYSAMPQGRSMLANLHRVDSSHSDNEPDRADAMVSLVRLHRAVGRRNAAVLSAVIWEDLSAYAAVKREYISEGRRPPRWSEGMFRFRGALKELARHWGL